MPGRPHHTEKWRSCVQDVMKGGKDESSAAAICTAQMQKAGEPIFVGAESGSADELRLLAEFASGESRELHLRLRVAAKSIRTAKYQGRDHLVVPVIALMEGVIHAVNADEPEFVPYETLAAAAHTWNGRPVMLGHPTKDGRQISANDPATLEKLQFGTIFQSITNGNRQLSMEAWVDPARLEALGETALLERIRKGEPIEVSVGGFVRTQRMAGEHNGKAYKTAWREAMGDHLAFLTKTRGACSLEMGCGAHRAAEGSDSENSGDIGYTVYEVDDAGLRVAAADGECPQLAAMRTFLDECERLYEEASTAVDAAIAADQKGEPPDASTLETIGTLMTGAISALSSAQSLVGSKLSKMNSNMYNGGGVARGYEGGGMLKPGTQPRSLAPMPDKSQVKVDCPTCDGNGQMDGKDCPTCDGTGKVSKSVAARYAAEWDESKHPRGKDGEFSSGGGDSGSTATEVGRASRPPERYRGRKFEGHGYTKTPKQGDRVKVMLKGYTGPQTGTVSGSHGSFHYVRSHSGESMGSFHSSDLKVMAARSASMADIPWFKDSVAPRSLRDIASRAARDISQKEREGMSDSDFAGKGTSFPIRKPEDVSAAARSIGRAGPGNYSSDQIKANIIRIAKRKGAAFVAALPESWKSDMKAATSATDRAAAGWTEDAHPRGEGGKFAGLPGGVASKTSDHHSSRQTAERLSQKARYASKHAAGEGGHKEAAAANRAAARAHSAIGDRKEAARHERQALYHERMFEDGSDGGGDNGNAQPSTVSTWFQEGTKDLSFSKEGQA